jgi:hypothetical protein
VLDEADGAGVEAIGGRACRGTFEHALGEVKRSDTGALACEGDGVAACAAADVSDVEPPHPGVAEEWREVLVLEAHERIVIGVVVRGPEVVAVAGGEGHEGGDGVMR